MNKNNDKESVVEKIKLLLSELKSENDNSIRLANETKRLMNLAYIFVDAKNYNGADWCITQIRGLDFGKCYNLKTFCEISVAIIQSTYENDENKIRTSYNRALYHLHKRKNVVKEFPINSIYSNLLSKFLDFNKPLSCRNIKDICGDYAFKNSYYEYNVINNITQFDQLFLYWKYKYECSDMDILQFKSIFNFYLGDIAESFIIFDEILDDGNKTLSSQQLFYYSLCSKILDVDFIPISSAAINQITLMKEHLEDEDYYYLGLIYFLRKQKRDAIKYLSLANTNYSFDIIDVISFGKIKNLHFNKTIIDVDNLGTEQFQHYFHICEYQIITNGKYLQPIWTVFKFEKDNTIESGKIESFILEKQYPRLKDILYKKWLDDKSNLLNKDNQLSNKLKLLEYLIVQVNPKMRNAFIQTELGYKISNDLENQLGLTIEESSLDSINDYILIIYFYYLKNEIDEEALIRLCIYLRIVTIYNRNLAIINKTNDLMLSSANAILSPFIDIKAFINLCKEVLDIIQNENNPVISKRKSEYESFKEYMCKIFIHKSNKESFLEKYKLYDFCYKIYQLDNLLSNYECSI